MRHRLFLGAFILLTVLLLIMIPFSSSMVMPQSLQPLFGPYLLDGLGLLWLGILLSGIGYFAMSLRWRSMFSILAAAVIGCGLVYPLSAIPSRASGFSEPETWSLDGNRVYRESNPELMAAVDWLWSVEPGVLVEAVPPDGGDYSEFGRVSMFTGLPAVLGWQFHEMQWRGGAEEIGTRPEDIALLYETPEWETAKGLSPSIILSIFISVIWRMQFITSKSQSLKSKYLWFFIKVM